MKLSMTPDVPLRLTDKGRLKFAKDDSFNQYQLGVNECNISFIQIYVHFWLNRCPVNLHIFIGLLKKVELKDAKDLEFYANL